MRPDTATDTLKAVSKIASALVNPDALVIDSKLFLIVCAVLINTVMFSLPPTFIYFLVKYQSFRIWVVNLLEDHDGKANKADAKDAVILFFAYAVGWILLDLILAWGIFEKDWLVMVGAVTFIWGGLLGISAFIRK